MRTIRRFVALLAVGSASFGASTMCARDASAAFIDVGAQAGVMGRNLSDTRYKPGFNFQIHGDLALIPPILMMGVYINGVPFGGQLKPDSSARDAPAINFQTFGVRGKLRIPIPGPVTPYAIAGVGYVRANFPDQTLEFCSTVAGASGCVKRTVPNATANFAELLLGVGFLIELAGPLHLSLEGAWRPSIGYKNEDYDKAIQNQSTQAPPPSRNGYAWSFHGGLAISL